MTRKAGDHLGERRVLSPTSVLVTMVSVGSTLNKVTFKNEGTVLIVDNFSLSKIIAVYLQECPVQCKLMLYVSVVLCW